MSKSLVEVFHSALGSRSRHGLMRDRVPSPSSGVGASGRSVSARTRSAKAVESSTAATTARTGVGRRFAHSSADAGVPGVRLHTTASFEQAVDA